MYVCYLPITVFHVSSRGVSIISSDTIYVSHHMHASHYTVPCLDHNCNKKLLFVSHYVGANLAANVR